MSICAAYYGCVRDNLLVSTLLVRQVNLAGVGAV